MHITDTPQVCQVTAWTVYTMSAGRINRRGMPRVQGPRIEVERALSRASAILFVWSRLSSFYSGHLLRSSTFAS